MSFRKPAERAEARRLRQAGAPYKRIARQLGVSPSSVVAWTRDIPLSDAQNQLNLHGRNAPLNRDSAARRAAAWSSRCRTRREQFQCQGRLHARRRDPLHLKGCMLYWAEGGKGRNQLSFSNSDVAMVQLFRRFLTRSLGVEVGRIRLRLNVHTTNGLTIDEIERYWLDALDLPRECLRKHALDVVPASSKRRAKNRLPYGVATLVVSSTEVVQHIYGAIQEYGSFEEPRWLG